jgi:outer membrane murein-binding lipoprotein Lpp
VSSPAGSGRIRLIVEIVLGVMALTGGVFTFVANDAKSEAQSQAQSLTVEVNVLNEDVESVQAERDAVSNELEAAGAEIEELREEIARLTGEEPEPRTNGAPYIKLDDNVGTVACTDGYYYGDWFADPIELGREKYWNGFSCLPYHTRENVFPVGHIDFKVPTGTKRVTGVIGFDDNSADTTMSAEFVVLSIGSGEEELFSEVLVFGDVVDLNVDLSGVSRVRFEVRVRGTDYYNGNEFENGANLSWADMQFE